MSEQYYSLGTNTAEQWQELHAELIADGNTYASVPSREVAVEDEKEHSATRGSYLLTDEEATALKEDPRVKFINIDYSKYPETYKAPPDELYASSPKNFNRYKNDVKVYKEMETSDTLPGSPDATDINRTNWGTLRASTLVDPWVEGGDADNVVKTSKIPQWGDGKHVDVIVADDGAGWIGHPEFNRDTQGEKPNGYTGGNLLPGNGSCDVLDLCLDGPLYLDPDHFIPTPATFARAVYATPVESNNYTLYAGQDRGDNLSGPDAPITIYVGDTLRISNTSPEGRHPLYIKTAQTSGTGDQAPGTTGQGAVDSGTVVFTPTETGTYYYQCSAHVNMSGTINVELGDKIEERWDGTIVPKEQNARAWWTSTGNRSSVFNAKFPSAGAVSFITSSYTRAYNNGTNASPSSSGQHCTPCMALTYGRTHGWAYNANKWVLNLYGTYGSDIEQGFDMQKIFHNTKPVNPAYGTQDPTVSSNSWGYRATKNPGGDEAATLYHHFRGGAATSYTSETGINWLSHMGSQGDGGRWKSEMKTNSLTTALDELCDSGVIFVCAAGNSNQKQTNWGHPDFDNYIAQNNTDTLEQSTFEEFGVEVTGTTNRRGFPQQGGKTVNGETGEVTYKTINIGALDDDHSADAKERKVGYSDRGNGIDLYAPADGILAANKSYTPEGDYPATYTGFTANSGSGAGVPEDCGFSGTSAACPCAAGFISTLVQFNRNWTYADIKTYLSNMPGQSVSNFYYGTESTSLNDSNWLDYPSLETTEAPKVIYQDATQFKQTVFPKRKSSMKSGLRTSGVQINYIQKWDRG